MTTFQRTAAHESGHAVAAHVLGGNVGYAWALPGHSLHGACGEADVSHTDPDKSAVICFAGCVAAAFCAGVWRKGGAFWGFSCYGCRGMAAGRSRRGARTAGRLARSAGGRGLGCGMTEVGEVGLLGEVGGSGGGNPKQAAFCRQKRRCNQAGKR